MVITIATEKPFESDQNKLRKNSVSLPCSLQYFLLISWIFILLLQCGNWKLSISKRRRL